MEETLRGLEKILGTFLSLSFESELGNDGRGGLGEGVEIEAVEEAIIKAFLPESC